MINKNAKMSKMNQLIDKLFPINRSITGKGVRKPLNILNEYLPLDIESVKSGTKVLNWKVPPEWVINEAWIKDPTGYLGRKRFDSTKVKCQNKYKGILLDIKF